MKNPDKQHNPWLSLWTRPRATMRQILDEDPARLVIVLAMLGGLSQALDKASLFSLGDKLSVPSILTLCIVLGSLSGIVTLYLSGVVLVWTGRWLGGQASFRQARAAVAWSNVPLIWALSLWVPEYFFFGRELFTSETPLLDESIPLTLAFIGFYLVEAIIAAWAVVVFIKCLAEAQRFSAWKAIANTVIASLVIILPIALAAMIVDGIIR